MGAWPWAPELAAKFRALAARANYRCLDRPDMGRAAKACCRRVSAPSLQDWLALLRHIRCLAGQPRAVGHFPWQGAVLTSRTCVGADFAGCLRTRKSTSGGLAVKGTRLLNHWAVAQKVIPSARGRPSWQA